jgi:hypothetical protein
MFTRPEPQSFTRFTVSVAVFLAIIALVLPGLVLRETAVLRISERELAGLSPTARDELTRRQDIARATGYVAPFVGLAFLICAGGLAWYGLPRLKEQEEDEKKKSTAELDKLLLDIRDQSETEREEGLRADVEEELPDVGSRIADPSDNDRNAQSTPTAGGDESGQLESRPTTIEQPATKAQPPPDSQELRDRMQLARHVEDQALTWIGRLAGSEYELRRNVSIRASVRLQLDGLLLSKSESRPDILVEIKLSSPTVVRKTTSMRLLEQAGKLMAYREYSGREATAWLVLVSDEPVPDEVRDRVTQQALGFSEHLRVTIIDKDELANLAVPTFG